MERAREGVVILLNDVWHSAIWHLKIGLNARTIEIFVKPWLEKHMKAESVE